MMADGVCVGDQTSNCGTGSDELLLFLIGVPAGVVLLSLAFYAGAYPWRYMWLMLLPLRLRRSFEARFHLDEDGRDSESEWTLMCRAAPKITEQYGRDAGVVVSPLRRRQLSGITEGLAVPGLRQEIWEPVRERPWLSRRWRQIQSVPDAASKVGTILRDGHPVLPSRD